MDRFMVLFSGMGILAMFITVTLILISVMENNIQEKIWKIPLSDPRQVYYNAAVLQLEKTHTVLFMLLAIFFIGPVTLLILG